MLGWREKCSDRYVFVRVDEFKNSKLKTLFYFFVSDALFART
jgi:hypothetical protein